MPNYKLSSSVFTGYRLSPSVFNGFYKHCKDETIRIAALIETSANPYVDIPSISDFENRLRKFISTKEFNFSKSEVKMMLSNENFFSSTCHPVDLLLIDLDIAKEICKYTKYHFDEDWIGEFLSVRLKDFIQDPDFIYQMFYKIGDKFLQGIPNLPSDIQDMWIKWRFNLNRTTIVHEYPDVHSSNVQLDHKHQIDYALCIVPDMSFQKICRRLVLTHYFKDFHPMIRKFGNIPSVLSDNELEDFYEFYFKQNQLTLDQYKKLTHSSNSNVLLTTL